MSTPRRPGRLADIAALADDADGGELTPRRHRADAPAPAPVAEVPVYRMAPSGQDVHRVKCAYDVPKVIADLITPLAMRTGNRKYQEVGEALIVQLRRKGIVVPDATIRQLGLPDPEGLIKFLERLDQII